MKRHHEMIEFDVAVPPGAALGEGPRWDAAGQTLLWVDIVGRVVHRYDPAKRTDTQEPVGELVSLALPRVRGGVVVGLADSVWALEDGRTRRLVRLEPAGSPNRTNDGACDARGRLWVSTMALDERSPTAALYVVRPDLTVKQVVGGVTVGNGLGWSPGSDRLYYIDSVTRRIDVFDFDLDAGVAGDRRPLAAVDADDALPDGMCVDVEGCLWVALHGGWGLRRYAPDGDLLREVRLPVAKVTSCAFGGRDRTELYVTTRRDGLGDADLAEQPLAGALLRLDAGVAGLPAYPFAG